VNNQGPELSPEARRLIEAARGADDPTAEDHARVKARWLASVAAVAGVSSLTEAARAAGGIGWGFKAAGAALVIAAGAIGLNFALDTAASSEANAPAPLPGWSGNSHERFQKTHSRPESEKAAQPAAGPGSGAPAATVDRARVVDTEAAPTAPPAQPEALQPVAAQPAVEALPEPAGSELSRATGADAVGVAPEVLAPQAVVPQAAVSPAAVSQAAAARARPASRAAVARAGTPKAVAKEAASPASEPVEAAPAAAGPSGQLGDEIALLSDVRGSIQEGAAARALELLNRYESRFGQPILGMEADALRVDALCKAGQREAARESARAFQNEWPGSPLERRVSAACP
jgi:ribonuclease E